MIAIKKLTLMATALLGLGTISTVGGSFVLPSSRAQDPRPGDPALTGHSSAKDGPAMAVELTELDRLVRQMLDVARSRFESQRGFYEKGRLTIDRYIDACEQLEKAELRFARSEEARNAIRRHYLTRLKDIETREKADVDGGRATAADLDEIRLRRMQVEIELKSPKRDDNELPAILKRLSDLERRVEQLEKGKPRPAGRP